MRFTNWCATALTAVGFLQSAVAQDVYTTTYYLERVQAASTGTASISAAVSTSSSSGVVAMQTGNAAAAVGINNAGFAAVVGMVGLAML